MLGFVQFQKLSGKWGGRENVTEWMFRDMVERAGLATSEDLTWQVQAAGGVDLEDGVEEGQKLRGEETG